MIIKALSLWEPWASLMRCGAKRIETRSWYTSYRGPLLICASRRRDREALSLLYSWHFQGGLAPLVGKSLDLEDRTWSGVAEHHLYFGKAVALVDLVDCRRTERISLQGIEHEHHFGDFSPGRFGWITRNLRVIEPFPVRGRQGLFDIDVPDDLLRVA